MLYILWGEDDFSIEETLQDIKNSLGDSSMLSTNTSVLDGQKITLAELKRVGDALPFLAAKRLIIIRGLLERFENNRAGYGKKSVSKLMKDDPSQNWAECIKGLPQSTILVLTDAIQVRGNSLKKNLLFVDISSKAQVQSFPLLRGIKLSQWIQSRVTQHGGSISQQAANLLMEFIGSNLHIMNNEITKLVAYTGGRMIEEKDVRLAVSYAQEGDIFGMIDAIMDRKVDQAEKILHQLLQNGIAPTQMLVLLARQVQMLVQVKDLRNQKIPSAEIQRRLGIAHEFIWQKISVRAGKYTFERLKQIYQYLLEIDLSIKTGRYEGDLALNILVAGLCST